MGREHAFVRLGWHVGVPAPHFYGLYLVYLLGAMHQVHSQR